MFNLKGTGGGSVFHPLVRFLLITSEIESFSTNFVTFPDIKCRI